MSALLEQPLFFLPLTLIVGLAAGFINVNAGGGSLLTLPLLILLGLPPTVANGTNRIGVLIQNIAGLANYHHKKITNYKTAILLTIPAILGSFIGATLAIDMNERVFQRTLALIMIGVLVFIIFHKDKNQNKEAPINYFLGVPIFFFVGLYGGFIQAGTGFIIIAALTWISPLDLIRINFVKIFVILVYSILVIANFWWHDKIVWSVGLTLGIAAALGGWLGTQFGIKKGQKWIKAVLIVSVVLFSLKLFFDV